MKLKVLDLGKMTTMFNLPDLYIQSVTKIINEDITVLALHCVAEIFTEDIMLTR